MWLPRTCQWNAGVPFSKQLCGIFSTFSKVQFLRASHLSPQIQWSGRMMCPDVSCDPCLEVRENTDSNSLGLIGCLGATGSVQEDHQWCANAWESESVRRHKSGTESMRGWVSFAPMTSSGVERIGPFDPVVSEVFLRPLLRHSKIYQNKCRLWYIFAVPKYINLSISKISVDIMIYFSFQNISISAGGCCTHVLRFFEREAGPHDSTKPKAAMDSESRRHIEQCRHRVPAETRK